MRRIVDALEEERMGGSRRRRRAIVGRPQKNSHVRRRSPAAPDIQHRPDEEPHHVVEKPIRLDLERDAARPILPSRVAHDASMLVSDRRRPANREAAERMVTENHLRNRIERWPVERMTKGKLPSAPKRRFRTVVRPDAVPVAAGNGAVSSVKVGPHSSGVGDPYVRG